MDTVWSALRVTIAKFDLANIRLVIYAVIGADAPFECFHNYHQRILVIRSGSFQIRANKIRIVAVVHMVLRIFFGVILIASIRTPRNLKVNRLSFIY